MNIGSNTAVNMPQLTVSIRPPSENTTGQTQSVPSAAGYAQNGAGMTLGVRGMDATTKGTEATSDVQAPKKVTDASGKEQNKEQVKKEDVAQAVSSVNDYIDKLRNRELQFSLDDDSGKMVIKIMETDTKKVIRQIPPEEMLRLADNIGKDRGWLVEQKA